MISVPLSNLASDLNHKTNIMQPILSTKPTMHHYHQLDPQATAEYLN